MADNFGLKIGLEGEKEFKKAIADINQSFKVLGSEMKLVSSEFGKNDTSMQAVAARSEVLNKQIDAQKQKIESLEPMQENVTVAMFYITSKGALYVRNNGDYMVKMLELAGGRYAPEGLGTGESGTRQMEMEAFYLVAGDADCILYIGQLGGKPKTLSQLIERNTLLADFKAVQNGRVYCTGADYFQQAGRLGDLIEDMNRMLSGDDAALNHIMKLE